MLTEIIYKGSVIGTVAPGESKILKCNGKKMTDDVTIKAGERTEIRVDGAVIAVAKAGETKTIKCAGKTMKSNIEIRVEDGKSGTDGFSPTVELIDISGGTRITITDINGPKSVDIMDGEDGVDGKDGSDGVSPTVSVSKSGKVTTVSITDKNGTKTATINDGVDGKDGAAGSNGVGIKSVVQTTTSSVDGGSNVITVTKTDDTTSTFTVKNGREGSDGKDGYTPIKGVDYFTDADKTELINAIKGSLTLGIASDGLIYLFVDGAPVGTGIPQGQSGDVFGYVDENNTIVLNGNLADGTYTLKYEMSNGDIVNIGNMVLDSTVYYTVTSNLTNCSISNSAKTVAQGSGYSAVISAIGGYELKSVTVTMGGSAVSVTNGVINIANVTGNIVITATAEEVVTGPTNLADPTSGDWQEGYRLSLSAGTASACTGHTVTNYIPAKSGDVLRVKGLSIVGDKVNSQYPKICAYNSSKSNLSGLYGATVSAEDNYGTQVSVNGDISTYTLMMNNSGTQKANANMAYIRIDGIPMDGYTKNDVVITINEEITD